MGRFAKRLGLIFYITMVFSLTSNDVIEAFGKLIERDCINILDQPYDKKAMIMPPQCFKDCIEVHPSLNLIFQSPMRRVIYYRDNYV